MEQPDDVVLLTYAQVELWRQRAGEVEALMAPLRAEADWLARTLKAANLFIMRAAARSAVEAAGITIDPRIASARSAPAAEGTGTGEME